MSKEIQKDVHTVEQLVMLIRNGTLSAESVVKTALESAKLHTGINAFTYLNVDAALTKASEIDQRIKSGKSCPPLAGLPICIKDNIDVESLCTTGATLAFKGLKARKNSSVVSRLVDAGAIVIGKTNLHELAFGITGTNFSSEFGSTKNPYDITHITGGSSGGTAAAIAARIVPVGLGTDTSGSIRIPAALCGVVGFRPSVGQGGVERRYAIDGVIPISHTNDTVGSMAASVKDIAYLDAVITGEAEIPPIPISELRLGMPRSYWRNLDSEVAEVCRGFCDVLKAHGATIIDMDFPELDGLLEKISVPVVLHEPINDIPTYLKSNGYSDITLEDITQQICNPDVKAAFDTILEDAFGADYQAAIEIYRPQLRKMFDDGFKHHQIDALFFPTTPIPAIPGTPDDAFGNVKINGAGAVSVFETYIRNTNPGANAGLSCLSIPIGTTKKGLPIGIEFDGVVGSDLKILSIGLSIEAITAPLQPPF